MTAVPATLLPPRRRRPDEWAEAELRVQDGPRAGQALRLFAFQRQILQSLGDDDVQFIDVMGSAQWGKTLILITFLGWSIAEDPASVLYVMPSAQGAGGALDFSRERVAPLIANTPALKTRVHGRREAGGSNTAASKTFAGGSVAFVGANSPAGLASRPVPRVLLDEVDRFPATGVGLRSAKSERGYSAGEGNVRAIAAKRSETFGRRRTIAQVSTPVNTDGPIHAGFQAGDQRRYVVACPHCGEVGILGWLGVDFGARSPVVAAVRWSADDGADAALTCRSCGVVWTDADRQAAVADGQWVAENPAAPAAHRSFHIWAAYSPLSRLPELAADYIAAQAQADAGDTSAMVTFRQTTLGLPVGVDGIIAPELERLRFDLLARRTDPAGWTLPVEARAVAAADVHSHRIELAVWAFEPDETSWLLAHLVLHGPTLEDDVWDRLDDAVGVEFSGRRVERYAVDAGYRTGEVDRFVFPRQAGGARLIYGKAGRPLMALPQKPEVSRGGTARLSWSNIVGVDEAKRIIYGRLPLEPGRPGAINLPTTVDSEFVAQLTSEREEVFRVQGRDRRGWTKLRDRNEALDLACYGLWAWRDLRRSGRRR